MGKKSSGNNYSVKSNDSNGDFARAKVSNLSVHFKNTVETANAVRGMDVTRALNYLKNVLNHKECVPFKKFKSGIGKTAQAKQFHVVNGRWPKKSAKVVMEAIQNAVSNMEYANLDQEQCVIRHIQVNQAPTTTRYTYRAHGRINRHIRHLCHIQLIIGSKKDGNFV